MGRHDAGGRAVRPLLVALVAIAVVAALALGWWWWTLRDDADPVSADPVSAYGSIVTSDACTTPGATSTVRFATVDGPVAAPLSACGYAPDQDVLVEYLRTDPQQVRLAGTGGQESSTVRRLLPLGVLFFGVVGGAALVVLATRPSGRRRAAATETASRPVAPLTTADEVPAGSWLGAGSTMDADRTATDLLPDATTTSNDGRIPPS